MCALNDISKIGLKCQKHILERKTRELPLYLRISGVQQVCVTNKIRDAYDKLSTQPKGICVLAEPHRSDRCP